MSTFSQYFCLNKTQPELDFVDVNLETDQPLFIDPYAISMRGDEWSQRCNNTIVSFFQTVINRIRSGRDEEAKGILDQLHEPNETCLGLSTDNPKGRGVSGKQALDLYEKLAESQAAKSGVLSELAECDLFIEGIGRDKISDITTNILRGLLIEYTHKQCELWNITLSGKVASGKIWNPVIESWEEDYVKLPIINGKKIILVPKYAVRRRMSLESQEYYNHYVLNFLQEEHLNANTSLVQVLKNGTRRVTKKDLKQRYPLHKEWLAEFTKNHPEVVSEYKEDAKKITISDSLEYNLCLNEEFNESDFANLLSSALNNISPGNNEAHKYHSLMIGLLEFILWPNLIYPKKEHEIHDGRKRIDITYTNAAEIGFFYRIHTSYHIASNIIMVECKNYTKDVKNPEFDQLSGRFSINRGKFGILTYRGTENYENLLKKCKDTSNDGRGIIMPLGDIQILDMLKLISEDKRNQIDTYIDSIFQKIIS
ncbi:TPA: hypothetical protein JBB15_13965 [Legionella pneumophila subsp. pneumophila]|nr:hypothetical protein [Legionella pneumophila subsp. pneumophila]